MYYFDFQGKKISALGFGMMRLPVLDGDNAKIDEEQVEKMIALAIDGGVNYFDTAWPYHAGKSELTVGKFLSKYPRESYFLADKFPGHQISESYNAKEIFETQLEKCGVDYFDFYLLHNVYENSVHVYEDERWGIIDYLKEQKKLGRIKHLGFSCHGGVPMLKEFLERHHEDLEFCQLQMNYLDWELQDAKTKYDVCASYNIPVWVMEPVRGGKLAKLDDELMAKLKEKRDETAASWAFRFLQSLDNVGVTLSGMSNIEQMEQNIKTFESREILSYDEMQTLAEVSETLRRGIPCTKCRYCCDGCPMGLDIPTFIEMLNDVRFHPVVNTAMRLDALDEDKRPSACIGCGQCEAVCPQGLKIPEYLAELDNIVSKLPKWAEISKKRAEEAEKLKREKEGK